MVDDRRQAKINFGFNLNCEIVDFLVNLGKFCYILYEIFIFILISAGRPRGLVDMSPF